MIQFSEPRCNRSGVAGKKNALLRGTSTIADGKRYHVAREMRSEVIVPFPGGPGLIIDSFPRMEVVYPVQNEGIGLH